jgi:Mn-dependent DtxR family transcriptional regulator
MTNNTRFFTMLHEILKIFQETDGPLDLTELSRRLGTQRSALEGMLETLVRQGKLREVIPGSASCSHCAGRRSCAHLKAGNLMGKVYELPAGTPEGGA